MSDKAIYISEELDFGVYYYIQKSPKIYARAKAQINLWRVSHQRVSNSMEADICHNFIVANSAQDFKTTIWPFLSKF